jgi:hypothetical protein
MHGFLVTSTLFLFVFCRWDGKLDDAKAIQKWVLDEVRVFQLNKGLFVESLSFLDCSKLQ